MTPSAVDVQPCTEPVGPTVPVSSDPLQMFAHFFDDKVIDLIVRESNRFALQSLAGTNKTWETNTEEIKAYLGFRIFMGIKRRLETTGAKMRNCTAPALHLELVVTGLRQSPAISTLSTMRRCHHEDKTATTGCRRCCQSSTY